MMQEKESLINLSELISQLYAQAMNLSIPEFNQGLFVLLHRYFEFDGAWLGRSTLSHNNPVMHTNLLDQLDEDFILDWEQVKLNDALVPDALLKSGQTFQVDTGADKLDQNFADFLAKYNISQILCVTFVDHDCDLHTHLSLYRKADAALFNEQEKNLLSALMPNLTQSIKFNRENAIGLFQKNISQKSSVAIFSQDRVLQFASDNLKQQLQLEWCRWSQQKLPEQIMAIPHHGERTEFVGKKIVVEMKGVGDLIILTTRNFSCQDLLTRREYQVAKLFSQGNTYKLVAKELEISPATVRHHLRNIYSKLDIQDKGEIAWRINQDG